MRKQMTAGVALATAAVLSLTGCGGSKSSSSSSSGSSSQALAQINTKDRADLKQGGTLRVAISWLPTNFNWMTIDGNSVDNNAMAYYYMPTNFDFDEKDGYTANKNYLTSYEVKGAGTAADPQVVTLHLNPKAKWNSGRTIDYTDYVAYWKANSGSNTAYKTAATDGFNQVKSVTKGASATDVVITFKTAFPDWVSPFSTVYPKESMSTPAAYNTGLTTPNANWEAGPFVYKSIDKAQKMITFVRNPKWWGDAALLDSVSFRQLEAPADVQAFANKEIDVVSPIISASAYQTAQKRTDGEIRASQGTQWRQFTLNSKSGVLADAKVRTAISLGTNTQEITKSDLAGLPVNAASQQLGNHFFMPGHKDYKDNSGDVSYNLDKAKSTLDADGWKLASGQQYRTKNGKQLAVNFTVLKGVPTSENEAKLFQSQMTQLGVKVNLVNISPDDMNNTLSSHSFQIIAFTWQGTNFPMNNIRQIYGAVSEGSTAPAGSNYAQLVNSSIEKLIPQADSNLDETKRAAQVNEIDKLIFNEVHTIPLYTRVGYVATPKNLANFGSATYASNGNTNVTHAENIGYTK